MGEGCSLLTYGESVLERTAGPSEVEAYFRGVFFKRILYYLDPRTLFGRANENVNLRFMHGINRISFFLFLICLVIMVVKACSR